MLKTTKSGITYAYPLDGKSNFKCESYRGSYSMIDAATYDGDVYVLLEHNFYGDETAYLVAVLPQDCFRWYLVETSSGKTKKYFFIDQRDIIGESFDEIDVAIDDNFEKIIDVDDIEIWTDEEINNMEVE